MAQLLYSQLPGTLDATFGIGGIVQNPAGTVNTSSKVVLVQPDGKIILAGETFDVHPGYDIVLARFHPDGSPDPTFGTNGMNLTETPGMTTFIFSATLLPDGKILLAGSSSPVSTMNTGCCFLARFSSEGILDSSFGVNGFVFDWITNNSEIYAISLQSDGKIVAAGSSQNAALLPVATIIRYDHSGQHDLSFGTNGVVITQTSPFFCQYTSVEWMPDGRIMAAGSSSYNNQPNMTCFLVTRYLQDGSPDPSFGNNGIDLSGKLGPISFSFGIKILDNGKIILAGRRVDDEGGFAVARYQSGGGLDTDFGANGSVSTAIGNPLKDLGRTMTVQPDGKILVAGITYPLDNTAPRLALLRYEPTGTLDNQFGTNGVSVIDMGQTKNYAYSIALQPDGKILVSSGYYQGVGSNDLSVARFHGGDTLVSIEKESEKAFLALYPNPASENLTMLIPDDLSGGIVTIYSLEGQAILARRLCSPILTINLAEFAPGVYMIHYQADRRSIISKFIRE